MIELIKRTVAEMLNLQAKTQYGTITAYDPVRHNVKVELQPEGVETGWVPLTSMWVGNGMGAVFGPMIGTACRVDFAGGNPEASIAGGRIFDAKNAPPVVQSGQLALVDKAGSFFRLNGDGTITTSGAWTHTGTITSSGDVKAGSISLENHVHGGVQTGGGTTAGPQ